MQRIRELGFMEARMHALHDELGGTTQSTLVARLEGRVQLEAVISAAERVREQHAILSVAIDEQEGRWFFAKPEEETPVVVEFKERRSDAEWKEVFLQRNSRKLADSLWALTLVARSSGERQRFEIVFQFHHALLDGSGALATLQALLAELGQCASRGRQQGAPAREVAAPLETYLPTVEWDEYVAAQAHGAAPDAGPLFPLDERPALRLDDRRTSTAFFDVGVARVIAMRAHCERNGLALNSYVAAALMSAVAEHSGPAASHGITVPFSLRRLCEPWLGSADLGCYLSLVGTRHRIGAPCDLDALAREHRAAVSRAVVSAIRHPKRAPLAATLRAAARKTFVTSSATARAQQILGFSLQEEELETRIGALELHGIYGAANRASGAVALAVHGLCAGGRLLFSVSHTEPLQSRRWAERVTSAFQRRLSDEAASERQERQ
jgi:hypothetical protein